MKVPLAFLKEYIQIDLSPEELSDLLTLAGLEVDAIDYPKLSFTDVVVAKVESTEKHPDADKLQIATVFDGQERWQVVCGAPNCREGLITAFARIGATLQDKDNKKSWKIKKAKLRGVESSGMLATGKELGLGEDHHGILELPEEMVIGVEIAKYFQEPLFEISLTPNLGHCMSILGIAKEIRAVTGKEINEPSTNIHENPDRDIEKKITTKVNTKACSRYCLRLIEELSPDAATPFWMQQYLNDSGLRPIHPVVDILNFVMLETGQPLHAFDYDRIAEKSIFVEQTTNEETFIGLDGQTRTVPPKSLVIKDANKTIALAGLMGGKNSSITPKSKTILIEAADFDGITVRKTSQKLALRTESSIRFEKGIDGGNSPIALDRACHLIEKICMGKVATGLIDIKEHDYVGRKINIRTERVNKLLGTQLSTGEIEEIFIKLGCQVKPGKENILQVQVPTSRNDLEKEIDLVEEVARIYGYNHIPKPAPFVKTSNVFHAPSFLLEKALRMRLTRDGLQEFWNCDITSPELAAHCEKLGMKKESFASICQASSQEYSVMRPSLLPGLLQVIRDNQDQKVTDIAGFELGYCYLKKNDGFTQQPMSSIILSGKTSPHSWNKKHTSWDFYDLKGFVENLFISMNIPSIQISPSSYEAFHPHIQAEISVNNQSVGTFGEIHPSLLEKFDIKQKVFFAQINSCIFLDTFQKDRKFSSLPSYPSSERDWTITLDSSMPIQTLLEWVNECDSQILSECFCLDLFEKDTETKNLTLRFVYRSTKKTLSNDEVEKDHLQIVEKITSKLKDLAKCSISQ